MYKKNFKNEEIEDNVNVKFRLQQSFNLFQKTWISGKVFSRKYEPMTQMHQKYQFTFKIFPSLQVSKILFFSCLPFSCFDYFHISGVEITCKDPQRNVIGKEYRSGPPQISIVGHLCCRLRFQQTEDEMVIFIQSRTKPFVQGSEIGT